MWLLVAKVCLISTRNFRTWWDHFVPTDPRYHETRRVGPLLLIYPSVNQQAGIMSQVLDAYFVYASTRKRGE